MADEPTSLGGDPKMTPGYHHVSIVALALALGACGPGGDGLTTPTPAPAFEWDLPPGFPAPRVPEDNPMSYAKVELGRYLFYDTALSVNETQSCASCHVQSQGFADDRQVALGSTGESHFRNAMGLTNVAYNAAQTWANPLMDTLEEQALIPMFGEAPVELGMAGREVELLERIEAEPIYLELFPKAFPGESDPFILGNITKALGAFERTLISGNSPYDKLIYQGDTEALSDEARHGMSLFFSEKMECFHCHGSFNFAIAVDFEGNAFDQLSFQNTGLYNIDGEGGFPAIDQGLYEITEDSADIGFFRAPTLRNIAVTAPYMHDGSIETLSEVLDHYAASGRTITEGPYAGVGSSNPNKSIFVPGFVLSEEERAAMLAFLESLTDEDFLTNPAYADPWE